jgi:predicted Rossmann-fold nucleotide-binding protein
VRFYFVQHEQSKKYYLLAEKIAYKISKAGYGVITSGSYGSG